MSSLSAEEKKQIIAAVAAKLDRTFALFDAYDRLPRPHTCFMCSRFFATREELESHPCTNPNSLCCTRWE